MREIEPLSVSWCNVWQAHIRSARIATALAQHPDGYCYAACIAQMCYVLNEAAEQVAARRAQ